MSKVNILLVSLSTLLVHTTLTDAATLNVPSAQYPTIQDGINAASNGDEVIVAPGTYNETINFDGKAIILRSSNGADVTTIDGAGLNTSVVTCSSGEGPDTVLEGFTITGGMGVIMPSSYAGGGMLNVGSSPSVTDCRFITNMQRTRGLGGGMYNSDNSNPTVTNCMFSENYASYGGGMYNDRSRPTVVNCTFTGNDVGMGNGGGMYNSDNSSPSVTNCTFTGHSANKGAGMYNDASSPIIAGCAFTGNTADQGGGMYSTDESKPTVTNCTFSGNVASGNFGGGMSNDDSSPNVSECTFQGNRAPFGGGMANIGGGRPIVTRCTFSDNEATSVGGGMYNSSPSALMLSNSTFIRNTAQWGGGIFDSADTTTIRNCRFVENGATNGGGVYNSGDNTTIANSLFSGNTADFGSGGGMYNNGVYPTVANCTFAGNAADFGAGIYSERGLLIVVNSILWHNIGPALGGPGFESVRYSNVQGSGGANPFFVDAAGGDFRLSSGSPSIDAGISVLGFGDLDLAGNVRFVDDPRTPDSGFGVPAVDMGAYEFGSLPPSNTPGDFDNDGDVDLRDFSEWLTMFKGPNQ